jgi:heparosan-N-sulfate-glucuronate 5-epimerase
LRFDDPTGTGHLRLAARLRHAIHLARRALRLATHPSYFHQPPRVGSRFRPDRLEGYFGDYSAKTAWAGAVDGEGLPVNVLTTGARCVFPITRIQKGLGHWERFLEGDAGHLDEVVRICDWLVRTQDDAGGWDTWSPLGLEGVAPYSALTQGQAVSLLVRAALRKSEAAYLEAARRAAGLMLAPVSRGGTARIDSQGRAVLEEYPLADPRAAPGTVLNGWISALYGLHDLGLARPDDAPVAEALAGSAAALVEALPRFDAGYWSLYDLAGNLASPYYHRRHLVQLEALERTFPDHAAAIAAVRDRWEAYDASRLRRARATARKAVQKLVAPPRVGVGG